MSRHQRPLTYVIGLGITLVIGIAIRLVQQQDVRSIVTTLTVEMLTTLMVLGSSDNNRQRGNARFVFSSFVNLADLGRDRTTYLVQ